LSTKRLAFKLEVDLSRSLILGLRWEYARVLPKAPKVIRRRVSTRPNIILSDIGKLGIADPETWTIQLNGAFAATHRFDAVRDVSDDGRTLYLDADLAEVTTITNGTAVAVTKYVTVPVNSTPYREIRLKQSAGELFTYSSDPENAISVRGKWAYSTSAPADIVQATIRLAAYMYAQKDASVFYVTAFPGEGVMTVPQGIPRDVREILDRRVKIV